MQVQPVTGYVNGHGNLEPESVLWIESTQGHHQAGGASPVS